LTYYVISFCDQEEKWDKIIKEQGEAKENLQRIFIALFIFIPIEKELLHHRVCSMLVWLTIAITEMSLVQSMRSIIGVLVSSRLCLQTKT